MAYAKGTPPLHPDIETAALADIFARERRVQIAPFLSDDFATTLRRHIAARTDWRLVINGAERIYEIDRVGQAQLSSAQRAKIDRMVTDRARTQFQYRYETVRTSEQGEIPLEDSPLAGFIALMNSAPAIDLLRRITGRYDISFADGQATAYSAGHLLTQHDDDVPGKRRIAAYTFGLSTDWQADWGGQLLFHDAAGGVCDSYMPRMNVLSLFAVPQPHSVAIVAPSAPEPRYSVTGWLRATGSS